MLGWMFLVTLLIFIIAKGRTYYMAPAYPMLLAAGAMLEESWLRSLSTRYATTMRSATFAALAIGGVIAAAVTLPLAPVNSRWWQFANKIDSDFREEIGWPELVGEIAAIYHSLPPAERASTGILAANYGEAGAIDLYGPAFGLPRAISGINSFWAYGYGSPPPKTLIVVGLGQKYREQYFQSCSTAGRITNPYGVENEETDHSEIYVCGQLRQSWPEFWRDFRYYG
jgi:hypothetical protein